MNMPADHVMVCEDDDQLLLTDDGLKPHARLPAGYLYVDGIVGDVGNGVLLRPAGAGRRGVVVVVVGVDIDSRLIITGPEVITRGLGLRGGRAARGASPPSPTR
jgi:ribonuclease J